MVTEVIEPSFTLVFVIAMIIFISFEIYIIATDMAEGEISTFCLLNLINALLSMIVGASLALLWYSISDHLDNTLYVFVIVIGVILLKTGLWFLYKLVNKK